jgi:hypothetical protein
MSGEVMDTGDDGGGGGGGAMTIDQSVFASIYENRR